MHRISSFYEEIFDMHKLHQTNDEINLGYDEHLLILKQASILEHTQLGLYHAAWRVQSEAELGWLILHLHNLKIPMEGFADHLVSKAVYLSDPEGNGIEIYWDRPKIAWKKDSEFQWTMVTEPLDVNALIDLAPLVQTHPHIVIGHVHFYVDQLPIHEMFYEMMGMKKMFAFGPTASFMAYDDYHHHLGLNTWNRQKANEDDATRLGLESVHLQVPVTTFLHIQSAIKRTGYVAIVKEESILVKKEKSQE